MWAMMTLTQYLKAEKITQAQFARRLSASQGTVSKLCTGRRPSWDLAVKIEQLTHGKVPVAVWAQAECSGNAA